MFKIYWVNGNIIFLYLVVISLFQTFISFIPIMNFHNFLVWEIEKDK